MSFLRVDSSSILHYLVCSWRGRRSSRHLYMSSLRGLYLVAAQCCTNLVCSWPGRRLCGIFHMSTLRGLLLDGSSMLRQFSLLLAWLVLFAASLHVVPCGLYLVAAGYWPAPLRHLSYVDSSWPLLDGSSMLRQFSLFLAWPALFAASSWCRLFAVFTSGQLNAAPV